MGMLSQILILLHCAIALASTRSLSTDASALTPGLCPYRTINYITHGLPQQCLATSRAGLDETDTMKIVSSVSASSTTEGATDLSSVSSAFEEVSTAQNITDEGTIHNPVTTLTLPPLTEDTATAAQPSVVVELAPVPHISEEDSALENENFLSFEDWKKQTLQKAGQSEHVGRRGPADSPELRKRPDRISNSLDSLGDDGEIDLDFSGFVPTGPEKPAREVFMPAADPASGEDDVEFPEPRAKTSRSKDAGTTCKERFNYASFDCAANVLKTNKEAQNPKTVLVENKDSYMLNQCSAQNKFIILELCNDISIDTVVLANFEFFSSTFRTFQVSVSDQYPVKLEKWKTIGTYEARNTREVQAFLVENPMIWARYVRIEFLSHYGNEFYCPVSLVRIHGTTMMEDWKHDREQSMNDDSDEDEEVSLDDISVDALTPEAVAEPLKTSMTTQETLSTEPSKAATSTDAQDEHIAHENLQSEHNQTIVPEVPASLVAMEAIASVIESSDTCLPAESPLAASSSHVTSNEHLSSQTRDPSPALSASTPRTTASGTVSQSMTAHVEMMTTASPSPSLATNTTDYTSSHITTETTSQSSSRQVTTNTISQATNSTTSIATATSKSKSSAVASDRPKSSSTSTHPHAAVPTLQDSFFKSVQKRLQMLETNSSMSLQYVEDQSRALRDAFKKVEQRQLSRTSAFLDQLNQTVLTELREFRQQYDQLWQSTVIELGLQRETYERDNEAINARIGILADEVIFQRRMAILQMVLILVCLVLVLFSRGAINNYLELPIVQNVLAKSPSSRWLNLSTDSLMRPAPPVRTRSAHQIRSERSSSVKGHRRMQSEDSITDTQSGPETMYAPPTPVSDYGHSEAELGLEDLKTPTMASLKEEDVLEDPEFDPSTIERPATSPPMLVVNGSSPVSNRNETSDEELIDTRLENKSDSLSNGQGSPIMLGQEKAHPVKRLSWNLPES